MSRGRTPRKAAPISRACEFVEFLEERQLLTTLQGGDVFNYVDQDGLIDQIRLVGSITAEFIGARVTASNKVVIRDLVPYTGPTSLSTTDNADLFQVYIASAAPDAQLIISRVAIDSNTGKLTATPYTGAGSLTVNPSQGGKPITVGLGGGPVYIGAKTRAIQNVQFSGDIPITVQNYRSAIGVRPGGKPLFAGIQTAPDVSMGKILIGGTVSGIVNIEGNVGEFYAGSVVTGDAQGLSNGVKTSVPNNFQIGGDLRALLVSGSIGTADGDASTYRSGVNIHVGGKIGYIHAGGDNSSSVYVSNSSSVASINTPIQEAEYTLLPQETAGDAFLNGDLNGTLFTNDNSSANNTTPGVDNNFQFGSTFTSAQTGVPESVEFSGTLDSVDGDMTDAYGLPLIAGQTVTLQLKPTEKGLLASGAYLGVFDPLGRLIATDLPDNNGNGAGLPFQITTTVPGTYRLVVALPDDASFTGSGTLPGVAAYTLTASGVGETALGGMDVAGDAVFMEPGNGIGVLRGDIGALQTGGEFTSAAASLEGFSSDIAASKGNLRALYAGSIGSEDPTIDGQKAGVILQPNLVIPRGTVGYVRSDGLLAMNPDASDFLGDVNPAAAVGFDYQRVEAGGTMDANLVANGAIGTISAGSVADETSLYQPVYSVNTDNKGTDGTIDLIYVTGDFGSDTIGGPAIYTNRGGNVKYIHVGGTTFRDHFFGGSLNAQQIGAAGQAMTFTDDSGAQFTMTPTSDITTGTTTGTTTGSTSTITQGALTVVYYPVREGGGVIVSVESTTSVNIASTTSGESVDISQLTSDSLNGDGPVYDPTFNTVGYTLSSSTGTGTGTGNTTLPVPTHTNAVNLAGRSTINVMNISGSNITSINNGTGGEIASVTALGLGTLVAQSAGFIKSNTAAEVDVPTNIVGASFPFNNYSYGIAVVGAIVGISVRDGLGVVKSTSAIGTITAMADGKNAKGILDGITAPIESNIIQTVNIGEGVAFGGTGATAGAGIFATGAGADIQQVVGENADIRGYVVSEGDIDNITLSNGSLIGAVVMTPTTVDQAVFTNRLFTLSDTAFRTTLSAPPGGFTTLPIGLQVIDYSLGQLNITGNGGILGSFIDVGDFNIINVKGFGIVSSYIASTATNNPDNIVSVGGLGVRDSRLDVGTSLNQLYLSGTGNVLNVNAYSPVVRPSSKKAHFDVAGSGRLLSAANDLNRALGTSNGTPALSGATNSGMLVDSSILGNGTLGRLDAFLIGSVAGVDISSPQYPMQINMANSVGKMNVTYIDGMQLTTGILGTLSVAKTTAHAAITATNGIKTIKVGQNMLGTTSIYAKGANGSIGTIFVRRGMYGTITADQNIHGIEAGQLGSVINASGNIDSILSDGDLLPTADIRARKKIGSLFVAGDVETGAKVTAASFGTKHIGGHNYGTITTTA